MYDRNGLELTESNRESYNSYKFTAVDFNTKRFSAYAASDKYNSHKFCMHTIKQYKDPRDAAYVGQRFRELYTKQQVSDMISSGSFREIVNEFLEGIEIPEWKYPPEGLTIEELLGEDTIKYSKNYVDNPKDALREAITIFEISKIPPIPVVNILLSRVEEYYSEGFTYRQAATKVVTEMKEFGYA